MVISGGDDQVVVMWRLDDALRKFGNKPAGTMPTKHSSNIFTLAVNSQAKHVLSGGNDHTILIHDYSK